MRDILFGVVRSIRYHALSKTATYLSQENLGIDVYDMKLGWDGITLRMVDQQGNLDQI